MKRTARVILMAGIITFLYACQGNGVMESVSVSMDGKGTEQTSEENRRTAEEKTEENESRLEKLKSYKQDNNSLTLDSQAWKYDKRYDVYWQIGVAYCSKGTAKECGTIGIYVPGSYLDGTYNGDGTYTCTVNEEHEINGYTGLTAPVVFPVNTVDYETQDAPSEYSYEGLGEYLDAGFIYVCPGIRGTKNGDGEKGSLSGCGKAPWGVTDLKAAIRYYRFNQDVLPGDENQIYCIGIGSGGGLTAAAGASGDSELYFDYLTSIGAAMRDKEGNYISDAISGAMLWCPITSLDYANEAYEWNMGQYSDEGSRKEGTWTGRLSRDMANVYGEYINQLGLMDENGNDLVLREGPGGILVDGSYYDYLLTVVEESLERFLEDTEFPYTYTGSEPSFGAGEVGTTYETIEDYMAYLNQEEEWVAYNPDTKKATVGSMEEFVKYCRFPSKAVGAFDGLNANEAENVLFGTDEQDRLHFDHNMSQLMKENEGQYRILDGWDPTVSECYGSDIKTLDSLGNDMEIRQNMYNPMYYVNSYYEGINTSNVAPFWNIRTGIEKKDTALTVEVNLALALRQRKEVKEVDFAAVWGTDLTMAEWTDDIVKNFVQWVVDTSRR